MIKNSVDLHTEFPLPKELTPASPEEKEALKEAFFGTGSPSLEEKSTAAPLPLDYETFLKVDLRVGTVLVAERVPKSDKLLRMEVTFGAFSRQILGGIGKTFQPEDLVGKQYAFIVNLAPRKMMGLESHGMILATGATEALTLLGPSCTVPAGSKFG